MIVDARQDAASLARFNGQQSPGHSLRCSELRNRSVTNRHQLPAVAKPSSVSGIDASVAHSARRYNYWLGGKDNFAADRASGDAIAETFSYVRTAAQENRRFLQRAVHYLASEGGIRQFLDVGTGLPAAANTHEVAQGVAPQSRIVYVDNDPLVMVHARALFTSNAPGRTGYIEADLGDPLAILTDETLKATLDMSKPVAVLLIAVLHYLPDDAQAYAAVNTLVDAMAPGSYLALSHVSTDLFDPVTRAKFTEDKYADGCDITFRSRKKIEEFFVGLDPVDPGLQIVSQWRPDSDNPPPPEQVAMYGGIARKWVF